MGSSTRSAEKKLESARDQSDHLDSEVNDSSTKPVARDDGLRVAQDESSDSSDDIDVSEGRPGFSASTENAEGDEVVVVALEASTPPPQAPAVVSPRSSGGLDCMPSWP